MDFPNIYLNFFREMSYLNIPVTSFLKLWNMYLYMLNVKHLSRIFHQLTNKEDFLVTTNHQTQETLTYTIS